MDQSKMSRYIYIGLGSNMGDRSQNLQRAIASMEKNELKILQESAVYESTAWGYTDQASFLNQVVEIKTDQSPENLLQILKKIENKLGRQKRERWHEREIDLDILLYGQKIVDTHDLTIPHQWMHKRKFVLVPLAEIAGNYKDPRNDLTIKELLHATTDTSTVTLYQGKPGR